MYKKHEIGKLGEQLAENYLIQNHYTILEKNFMCKQGEIDIIAFGENYLVFIEVKTRSSLLYGKPIDSVNNIKQKHLYKSAKFYLYLSIYFIILLLYSFITSLFYYFFYFI